MIFFFYQKGLIFKIISRTHKSTRNPTQLALSWSTWVQWFRRQRSRTCRRKDKGIKPFSNHFLIRVQSTQKQIFPQNRFFTQSQYSLYTISEVVKQPPLFLCNSNNNLKYSYWYLCSSNYLLRVGNVMKKYCHKKLNVPLLFLVPRSLRISTSLSSSSQISPSACTAATATSSPANTTPLHFIYNNVQRCQLLNETQAGFYVLRLPKLRPILYARLFDTVINLWQIFSHHQLNST